MVSRLYEILEALTCLFLVAIVIEFVRPASLGRFLPLATVFLGLLVAFGVLIWRGYYQATPRWRAQLVAVILGAILLSTPGAALWIRVVSALAVTFGLTTFLNLGDKT